MISMTEKMERPEKRAHLCCFIFFLRLRWVLSSWTARPSSAALSAVRPSAGLRPSRWSVASQPTELLTAFIARARARSRAVSASASGVVSGGLSSVAGAAGACVRVGPRTSVEEASKRTAAGWESTSGRCWAKNWCRRRSGALSGGWEASTVGAEVNAGRAGECGGEAEGKGEGGTEGSSGGDEDDCWGSLLLPLLLGVLASTRVGDFALAEGTTLGGLDELKNLPPGGFENRE